MALGDDVLSVGSDCFGESEECEEYEEYEECGECEECGESKDDARSDFLPSFLPTSFDCVYP